MLVLSRKLEESILVDGRVKITILQIKGRKVRVGIEAPDDVQILRAELEQQRYIPSTELECDAHAGQFAVHPG